MKKIFQVAFLLILLGIPNYAQSELIKGNFSDIVTMGPYADVRAYSSINAAVTAIGSTPKTLLVSSNQTLSASLTIPSTLELMFYDGGSITKASTYTLTINGPVIAGAHQIFIGFSTGEVLFGANVKSIFVEWFGGKGNGSVDNSTAISMANSSLTTGYGGTVEFLAGDYNTSTYSEITASRISWKGQGRKITSIISTSSTSDVLRIHGTSGTNINYITVRDLQINRNTTTPTAGSGIWIQFTEYVTIEDVSLFHHNIGLYEDRCQYLHVIRTQVQRTDGNDSCVGFYMDCTNGYSSSTYFLQCVAIFYLHTGDSTGFYGVGDYLQDKWFENCGVERANYGWQMIRDTIGSWGAFDIKMTTCYTDSITYKGVYFKNVTNSSIVNHWHLMAYYSMNNFGMHFETCYHITVSAANLWGIGTIPTFYAIWVQDSESISIQGNFYGMTYGVYSEGGKNNSIIGCTFWNPSGSPATAYISMAGTTKPTRYSITGNVLSGYATYGMIFQDGADYMVVVGNSIDPTNIGTPIYNHVNNTHQSFFPTP